MFSGALRLIQVPIRGLGQASIQAGQGFGGSPWSVETPLRPNVPPAGYTGEIIAPYGAETELGCYYCPDTGRNEIMTRPEAQARGCSFAPRGSCPEMPTMAPAGAMAPGSSPSYAKGPPPGLMGQRLGQVSLWQGPAGSPFYSTPPAGVYVNPSGAPLMTEELTSPQSSDIAREYHCYQSPDGKEFRSVPFALRDAYIAAGWVATNYANCGTPPLHAQPVGNQGFVMGQKGGGGGGAGGGAGAPAGGVGTQSAPSPASPAPAAQDFSPDLLPTLPLAAPYAYPAPAGSTCAWEKDANGNSIYVCRPVPGTVAMVPPVYGPVSYPVRPFCPAYW
jgi:hypothetical protein